MPRRGIHHLMLLRSGKSQTKRRKEVLITISLEWLQLLEIASSGCSIGKAALFSNIRHKKTQERESLLSYCSQEGGARPLLTRMNKKTVKYSMRK